MVSPWIRDQNRRANDTTAPHTASPDGWPRPVNEAAGTGPGGSAPSCIRLCVEDGLLMVFGPDGDPVPPGLLTATCRPFADQNSPIYDGKLVDPERMAKVLLAQQTGMLAAAGRRCDQWIEAMLGVVGQFEPTPADLLAAEAKTICRTKGDGLQFLMPSGERLWMRDAHPGRARSSILAKLVFENNALSIDQLKTLLNTIREPLDTGNIGLTTSLPGRLLVGRDDAVLVDLGDCKRARLLAAEPIWCGEPMLELSLSDGRGLGVDHLLPHLRCDERPNDVAKDRNQ